MSSINPVDLPSPDKVTSKFWFSECTFLYFDMANSVSSSDISSDQYSENGVLKGTGDSYIELNCNGECDADIMNGIDKNNLDTNRLVI